MSLNAQEMENTRYELAENFRRTGLTEQQVADDLGISLTKLQNVMTLNQCSLEDPWILRNYLLEKVEENGEMVVPFSALAGDWNRHWFLNSRKIDSGKMSSGDF